VNFDFSFVCAAISNASSETSNENVSSAVTIEMIAAFIHFTPLVTPGCYPEFWSSNFSAAFLILLVRTTELTLGAVRVASKIKRY
jgi:hypothetical protein